MRVDYARIPELHLAARRHRAEFIGALIAAAFVWLLTLGKRATPARHSRTLARGW